MRVLYGVCGDGMGHATRSAVVARRLLELGHDVRLSTTSRGARDYLRRRVEAPVQLVRGLEVVYGRGGRVEAADTLWKNLSNWLRSPELNVPAALEARRWGPDVVLCDFDAWSAYLGHALRVPVVAVDNVHFLTKCSLPRDLPLSHEDRRDATLMRVVVDQVCPNARSYVVLSIAAPLGVAHKHVSVQPPILRPEVVRARPHAREGDHLVSYLNAKGDHDALLRSLSDAGLDAHHYGDPRVKRPERAGSVTRMPFSEGAFLEDLASCRGVVSGAGFTTIAEAAYLGKPVLAHPSRGLYEQALNAMYVERLGWGRRSRDLSPREISEFHDMCPAYADRLRGGAQEWWPGPALRSVERAVASAGRVT